MNTIVQYILVALLVAAAGFYLLRRIIRAIRPKEAGCDTDCGCAKEVKR